MGAVLGGLLDHDAHCNQVFRPFLVFMYTRTIADADLHAHAAELMAAANEYQMPQLHEKCEMYLCWKVQVICLCGLRLQSGP